MQYTYELREPSLCSPAKETVFDNMAEALRNHVFLDKGAGPIESGYEIRYFLPESLIMELGDAGQDEMLNFRRRLFNEKHIPREINIFIYSKVFPAVPVMVLGGTGKKIISIASAASCS